MAWDSKGNWIGNDGFLQGQQARATLGDWDATRGQYRIMADLMNDQSPVSTNAWWTPTASAYQGGTLQPGQNAGWDASLFGQNYSNSGPLGAGARFDPTTGQWQNQWLQGLENAPPPAAQTPSLQNVGMPQAFTPASAPAVAQSPFGGSGSGSSSDAGSLPEWQQYMNAYPDLNPAYAKDSYGLSPEQFAQTHFDKFGQGEGRTWPGETVTDMQQPIPSAPSGPREIDPGWMGNNGMPALGAGNAYTPPAPAAGSAAATNPYLALSLNNLTQAGQFNPSVLGPLAQSMWNQANRNWSDNINPALDSSAITAGGFGGDRAALAKGVMASRMNEGIFNALAPQYVNMFEGAQNRNLQAGQAAGSLGSGLEQLDLSRLLGIGNLQNQGRQLDISQQGADTNTASAASGAAGTPTYTNPLGAGLGGALTLWQLLGLGG
jgi:hypothetical protein